jgi:hypothetical protein
MGFEKTLSNAIKKYEISFSKEKSGKHICERKEVKPMDVIRPSIYLRATQIAIPLSVHAEQEMEQG